MIFKGSRKRQCKAVNIKFREKMVSEITTEDPIEIKLQDE